MSEQTKLPWSERVNCISVNPEMATIADIARLAAEHSDMTQLLILIGDTATDRAKRYRA